MRHLILSLLLLGCPASSSDDDDTAGANDDDAVEMDPELVANLDIVSVTANQGVEVTLMADGNNVSRNAPIIVNRPLLLRAYVEPHADYENTVVLGTLIFDGVEYEDTAAITGPSEPGDLDSTLHWIIDAEDVRVDSTFRIELWDSRGGPGENGNRHSWPESGEDDLDATSAGGTLKVVVLPIRWDADGSGRLPDTGPEQVELFAALLQRVFPAREVSVELADVFPWDDPVTNAGDGWSELLNAVLEERNGSNIDVDEYWYGLFQPTETMQDWCGSTGCRMGLGFVLDDYNSYWARAGLGIGFDQFQAMGTMAHELGHLHGRYHADCGGASGIDPFFPYDDAALGAWGWDIFGVSGLQDPDTVVDLMSYCDPVWVSDYTYERLHNRMRLVESSARIEGVPQTYWSAAVSRDGTLGKARAMLLPIAPAGRGVSAVDGFGQPMNGAFVEAMHAGGGVAIFPREPLFGASVQPVR
jgi:hypothetical protein